MQNILWVVTPEKYHNTYGIRLESNDTELQKKFIEIATERFLRTSDSNLKAFWQAGHSQFSSSNYFEFLSAGISKETRDRIISQAKDISKLLGINYLIYDEYFSAS